MAEVKHVTGVSEVWHVTGVSEVWHVSGVSEVRHVTEVWPRSGMRLRYVRSVVCGM